MRLILIASAVFATALLSLAMADDAGSDDATCPDAISTYDMNECYGQVFERANKRKAEYLAAALARNADREEVQDMIRGADKAFEIYREAECKAVHEDFKGGTIRGIMYLTCNIALTDQRTHTI